MKPTRTEMLLAWMTLAKARAHYKLETIDPAGDMMMLDTMKMLDKLQQEEAKNEKRLF